MIANLSRPEKFLSSDRLLLLGGSELSICHFKRSKWITNSVIQSSVSSGRPTTLFLFSLLSFLIIEIKAITFPRPIIQGCRLALICLVGGLCQFESTGLSIHGIL